MTCQVLKRDDRFNFSGDPIPNLVYEAFIDDSNRPVFLFLSGYRSDMNGTKATALAAWARSCGSSFIRFDYRGHGQSGGYFEASSLADWLEDAVDIFDHLIPHGRSVVLIGSSMGGWLALVLALRRSDQVMAVVGLAAAPDFTVDLYTRGLNEAQRVQLDQTGRVDLPSAHGPDPYVITRQLIDDGARLLVLSESHDFDRRLILFQGGQDPTVDPMTPERIKRVFPQAKTDIYIIPDGDHGLSRPADLKQITDVLAALEVEIISGDS